MGRAPCCAKVGLHRGPWTPKEDSLLVNYINTHGEGQWRSLPKKAGLLRCGKSCRLRWMNYLRPDIKRGNITPDEDDLIIRLHALLGNRWSLIAGRLPGRTDNEIKNYWNTHLSKMLRTQGIDPETHKKLPILMTTPQADDGVDDPVLMSSSSSKQPKNKKMRRTNTTDHGSKKNYKIKQKMMKRKKNNKKQQKPPNTSCNSSSTLMISKTKVHLPKAVRLTAPLSSVLTRNSSNASFESNLTSCLTTSTRTNTTAGITPLLLDHQPNFDHDLQPIGDYVNETDAASAGSGVRFLIGTEEGDDHGNKFEKLYEEYLQLIKVGDDHHHQIDSSSCATYADFSYSAQAHQDHEFDLFADSLLI